MIIIVQLLFERINVFGYQLNIFNRIQVLDFLDVLKQNMLVMMIDYKSLMDIEMVQFYVLFVEKIRINVLIVHH
jgi:hypothetical protein